MEHVTPTKALYASDEPIKIGVSSCLLGEQVRFDGGHKRARQYAASDADHDGYASAAKRCRRTGGRAPGKSRAWRRAPALQNSLGIVKRGR
jgi:hypothetical protein